MKTENRSLALESLIVGDSKYRLSTGPILAADDLTQALLSRSLEALGLQSPLLVHEERPDSLHVVDGFRRTMVARRLGWETVACRVLPPETSIASVLELLLVSRRRSFEESLVTRIRFLRLAIELGVARATLCRDFLPALALDGHEQVLRRCEAVAKLSEEVLSFCEEKSLSLKQCFRLTRHPPELLSLVFSWKSSLSLTRSMLEELLEQLNDYLRAHDAAPEDLLRQPDIQGVLESRLHPQERTRHLRDVVRRLRFPTLTASNRRMEGIRAGLSLPPNVVVSWDPTLERHALDLRITIREPRDWAATLAALQTGGVDRGLCALLEAL